jgi:sigma-B regulation protein RsbU (phosphoserine phosphatase)
MSRLRRVILVIGALLLLLSVYVYDVARSAVTLTVSGGLYAREGAVFVAFLLLFFYMYGSRAGKAVAVPKNIGRLLGYSFAVVLIVGAYTLWAKLPADTGELTQTPGGAIGVLLSTILAVMLGLFAFSTLLTVRDLVFFKRKKGTKRNFVAYLVLLVATNAAAVPLVPPGARFVSSILFSLSIVMIVVNSFKQNWVVYLSRREKLYAIAYSALLFLSFLSINALISQTSPERSLVSYHAPLQSFIQLNALFGVVYFGMTFVSALFHLPTAEVYERKQSELTSLHNLSRLVTQVFDFSDLVNSVTSMTQEVVGAKSAWLELIKGQKESGEVLVEVVSLKDISRQQIEDITVNSNLSLRQLVIDSKRALVIDDVANDRRTKHIKKLGVQVGSLLSVPLISHNGLIGFLHATKDYQYGFDQDDVDVLTTFADHVTIAIENSRLIAQSLERERFQQEMMVAQRMQKRLLPQRIPQFQSLDIAALSEPSSEVGGDYYDFVSLDADRFGVVVGDVSGKGVSAAFYMAEVKGIFQSLSKICTSPRELLLRANQALMGSLERKAFVSLLYAIFNRSRSSLTLARAGHCPMIHISGATPNLVRPTGIGLGLTYDKRFEDSTQEVTIPFKKGDVCVFYTDGLNESRNAEGEEFGFERLLQTALNNSGESAEKIKENILREIKSYTGDGSYGDDVTLVVVKAV